MNEPTREQIIKAYYFCHVAEGKDYKCDKCPFDKSPKECHMVEQLIFKAISELERENDKNTFIIKTLKGRLNATFGITKALTDKTKIERDYAKEIFNSLKGISTLRQSFMNNRIIVELDLESLEEIEKRFTNGKN